MDPNLRTPYVQEWNAGIQHAFKGVSVEARYVGNHGVKEWRGIDYNQVDITSNGFLDDFLRAYNNGYLALAATGTFNPAYNSAISGSQPLTIFPKLSNGGNLTNGAFRNLIQTGQPGQLAYTYQVNRNNGNINFFPNPYAVGTFLVTNAASSSYNGLVLEARQRATSVLHFP